MLKMRSVFAGCLMTAALLVSCSGDDPAVLPDEVDFADAVRLSQFGFFTGDLADLQPAEDVFLYELSTPLFSDYTIKDRFIRLPEGTSMTYQAEGIVTFPPGTIIIKNFSGLDADDAPLRLETRLLFLDPADGKWKVTVYLWRADQTDADRFIVGKTLPIRVHNSAGDVITTNYQMPNTNDCKRCHNSTGVITPIGPKIRNLNFTPSGATENQLDQWNNEGRISGLPASGRPALPEWDDAASFTLDERARAYLDVNCAHCHTVGGDAFNSGLFLEYEQSDSSHLGVYKVPVSAGPGSGSLTYDIVPGDADASIVHFRMNSSAPGIAMPELARSVVHEEGVELIRDWINSL